MTDQEIIETVINASNEAIDEFEKEYNQEPETEQQTYFILAFILVLFLGSKKLKSNNIFANSNLKKQIVKANPVFAKYFKGNTFSFTKEGQASKKVIGDIFGDNYKGIKSTTTNQLEALKKELDKKKLTIADVKKFNAERKKILTEDTKNIVKQNSTALLARSTGFSFVGAITRKDDRVRESHAKNHRRYWRVAYYQPWRDYNCRCAYIYFKTKAEIKGFKKLKT
jgi:hypothetical protein